MLDAADRQIVSDLYLSRAGLDFVETLVERFGARFGGTPQEHAAAAFIRDQLAEIGAVGTDLEKFTCGGWTRKDTSLAMLAPIERTLPCIALPYCPPGAVEGPLVFLGDGDPNTVLARQAEIKGAIAMTTTATPKFFHRQMHRCEKLGRALDAGAIGFIWMRGEAGGLPETGSARFGHACEVPAISVSFETGQEMVRLARRGASRLRITSTNENHEVTSYNPVGEFRGRDWPNEVIVLGAHYDGHDISQGAMDNATGAAVVLEAARALAPHRGLLRRTVRFVAFAQEEMGLHGAHAYANRHKDDNIRFMLNLDGAGRSINASFQLQGWPEGIPWFKGMLDGMLENNVQVGDQIGLYSDMYPFAAVGIPAATIQSESVGSTAAATRGYGHTAMDTLDKVTARLVQLEAIRVARIALRLATADEIPLARKRPAEIGARLQQVGLDEVLRYEKRPVPGE